MGRVDTKAAINLAIEARQKASMSFIDRISASSQPLIGTILTIGSTTIAQVVGLSESDVIMIDMEHAPLSVDVVTQMVHAFTASSRGKGVPLIRVPSHGVEWVGRLCAKIVMMKLTHMPLSGRSSGVSIAERQAL